ncbi:MAG TPA: ATP-binding protein, partial [Candidatus Kapabacteria bacterium]|nr:ATP-binding protein [Candidatus Kapabacteria bacterium]
MEINLKKAVKQFFPNPSLDMIYFEAIANAINAGATEISIAIQIESFLKQETLLIKIEDNGKGFTDENFARFSKLMETEEENHKGLGRLVYLNYFKSVDVISYYEDKKRIFEFNDTFSGESKVEDSAETKQNTCLSFNAYLLAKIKTYDYINPPKIKELLKLHFYPQFHSFKINNRALTLSIRVDTNEPDETHDFYNRQCQLNVAELPDLEENTFKVKGLNLFDGEMTLHSSIQKIDRKSEIITAVCVENRTIPWEIIRPTDLPDGYEALFLLYSDYFDGKVNFARNKLDLEPHEKNLVEEEFIKAVSDILIEKIPSLVEKNRTVKKDLTDRYPHLQGYFNSKAVGLLSRESTLETAQKQFFKEQKGILEANSLNDEQFQKSMEISSRLLTEYVL